MQTLIVRYEDKVRFLVTNHPDYRFTQLQRQMPVQIVLFGVTSAKAKDIKLSFVNQHLQGEWFRLTDEFEQYLSRLI